MSIAHAPSEDHLLVSGLLVAIAGWALFGMRMSVVPIVANAGAALLPMMIGMVTNVLAVLLKPRELLRHLRAKPWLLPLLLVIAAGVWWGWGAMSAPATAAATTAAPGTSRSDWTKVALAIIERERMAPSAPTPSVDPGPQAAPISTAPTGRGKPLIFRGDSARCGHGGGPAPIGLQIVNRFSPDFEWFIGGPLVSDGRIYTASCYLDGMTSKGTVYCLEAATGKMLWSKDTYVADGSQRQMKGFFSSPALSGDGRNLIIGQGLHPDSDLHLLCLDTSTGDIRWAVHTPLHIESSPAIDGDVVVVGCGAIEDPNTHKPLPGTDPGFVLAVRISDGQVLWRHPIKDPESSPAIHDGLAIIGAGFNGNAVVALRLESDADLSRKGLSREAWRVETPFPATGAVTLVDGLALVGCGNGDVVYTPPVPEGMVIAIDAATGSVRWRTDRGSDGTPIPREKRSIQDAVLGAIAARDGVAICPVRNGELVALRLGDGSLIWRQQDPRMRIHRKGTMIAGPALADGRIYALTTNGFLGVIDAADGKVIEKLFVNSAPGERSMSTSSPWIQDGRIYVGSETGGMVIVGGR